MEKLVALLKKVKPNANFENEDGLIDKGIIDSLDVISIIAEISEQYGIVIPNEEIIPDNFNSVEALKELIDDLM